MLQSFMSMFHTFQHKEMPEIEIIEHTIPKWVTSDWKLYKEILTHIILLSIKAAGKFGKITITVSFISFNKKLRQKRPAPITSRDYSSDQDDASYATSITDD